MQTVAHLDISAQPPFPPVTMMVNRSTNTAMGNRAVCPKVRLPPGDEVFRSMVVGDEDLLKSGMSVLDLRGSKAADTLTNFAQSHADGFWTKFGRPTGRGYYEVGKL